MGVFFNNSLTADLTYYHTNMVNQWLPKNAATGGQLPLTSGKIANKGIETSVSYTIASNRDFNWKTSVNYSYNFSDIINTYDGGKEIDITPVYQGGLIIKYKVGSPYGELYGKDFLYDANGNIQTDRSGSPKFTTTYDKYLGNANSPHHFGWSNYLKYKNFDFYMLIDGKVGGVVVSYTQALMDYYGVSERSGKARDEGHTYITTETVGGAEAGVLVPGVTMPDGNIAPAQGYFQALGGGEPYLNDYTYSATNIRLREASIGYTFRNLFGNSKNLYISMIGRNLFFILKKSPVDPDISVSTANGYGGIEAFSSPTTRSYGISIKANF